MIIYIPVQDVFCLLVLCPNNHNSLISTKVEVISSCMVISQVQLLILSLRIFKSRNVTMLTYFSADSSNFGTWEMILGSKFAL